MAVRLLPQHLASASCKRLCFMVPVPFFDCLLPSLVWTRTPLILPQVLLQALPQALQDSGWRLSFEPRLTLLSIRCWLPLRSQKLATLSSRTAMITAA